MRIVKTIKKIEFKFKFDTVIEDSSLNQIFGVNGKSGNISFFNKNGLIIKDLKLNNDINGMGFNYNSKLIFIASPEALIKLDWKGKVIANHKGDYLNVILKDSIIWTIKRIENDLVKLEVFESSSFKKIAELEIRDLFDISNYWILDSHRSNSIVIWIAGGQDGQQNFLATLDEGIIELIKIGDEDTYPIYFSPSGNQFINNRSDQIDFFSFPKMNHKYSISFDWKENYIEEVKYLDDNQVLIKFYDRLILFNSKYATQKKVYIFHANETKDIQKVNKVLPCKEIVEIHVFGEDVLMTGRNNLLYIADKSIFVFRNVNQFEIPYS